MPSTQHPITDSAIIAHAAARQSLLRPTVWPSYRLAASKNRLTERLMRISSSAAKPHGSTSTTKHRSSTSTRPTTRCRPRTSGNATRSQWARSAEAVFAVGFAMNSIRPPVAWSTVTASDAAGPAVPSSRHRYLSRAASFDGSAARTKRQSTKYLTQKCSHPGSADTAAR